MLSIRRLFRADEVQIFKSDLVARVVQERDPYRASGGP
jgi:hypothetical protein